MGDEVIDAATAGMPHTVKFLGEELKITEADKLKHRGKASPTFLSAIWQGVVETKGLLILILLLAAYEIYHGRTTPLIFLGLGLLAWLAFLIAVRLPAIYYGRLHKAADWYRWTEVLEIVNKLKKIGKIHIIKLPPPELGRYRAKALAGLGHLSEALSEYSQFENQPGCPSWLYHAFVAGIYDIAKQHNIAIELTLQSIRENARPTIYIDLANRYLRYKKDPAKAREALAEAEKSTLVDVAKPFVLRCRGILAFLEGDYTAARKELEAFLDGMTKNPHIPYHDGITNVGKAYLSCVLAKQGDLATARKNFLEAEEYFVATGETELLEQCKKATEM
ncbi:MAG TPA: hypothetical protein VKV04_06145 [Verrucomicrobiae bacterium]|nr:hypothetical protein [Verrucomicrobiae bacterium]